MMHLLAQVVNDLSLNCSPLWLNSLVSQTWGHTLYLSHLNWPTEASLLCCVLIKFEDTSILLMGLILRIPLNVFFWHPGICCITCHFLKIIYFIEYAKGIKPIPQASLFLALRLDSLSKEWISSSWFGLINNLAKITTSPFVSIQMGFIISIIFFWGGISF